MKYDSPAFINENTKAHENLIAAAALLTAASPNGYKYTVDGCWFDWGAKIYWTTILRGGGFYNGVQIPNPLQWRAIVNAESPAEIAAAVADIMNGEYFGDK